MANPVISQLTLDYILHKTGSTPGQFISDLGLNYWPEIVQGPGLTLLNYYCQFKMNLGILDIHVLSNEYSNTHGFLKLLGLQRETGNRIPEGTSYDKVLDEFDLKPCYLGFTRPKGKTPRYWHKFRVFDFYQMPSMIPILEDNPLRKWRLAILPERGETTGAYNYIITHGIASQMLGIGALRLENLEVGSAEISDDEWERIKPEIAPYGDLTTWYQTYSQEIDKLEVNLDCANKMMKMKMYSQTGKYKSPSKYK